MFSRRHAYLSIPMILLALPLLAQDQFTNPFRPSGRLKAIQEEFVRPAELAEAEAVGEPPHRDLRVGVPASTVRAAERFAASRNSSVRGIEAIEFVRGELARSADFIGAAESPQDVGAPEAIIIADATRRPALLVCGDRINEEVPPLWADLLNPRQEALERTMASVGLIMQRPGPGFQRRGVGTAFVVAPGILMTNRHVADIFSVPNGDGGWDIIANQFTGQPQEISINFTEEYCGTMPNFVRVAQILHIEPKPGPDVALLRVEGMLPPALPLQSGPIPAADLANHNIYVSGYPFDDPRNPLWARLEVFGNVFGVKRLAPGRLQQLSGQPLADGNTYLLHDSSTLGGNSGSPVVDLDSNKVIGLHFSGSFQEANFAWPMWQILAIPAVKNAIHSNGNGNGSSIDG